MLDYEYGKSQYFDYYESDNSKLTFLSNSSHAVIVYNGSSIVANATHPYQLKLDSWLIAPRSVTLGGTTVEAKIEYLDTLQLRSPEIVQKIASESVSSSSVVESEETHIYYYRQSSNEYYEYPER